LNARTNFHFVAIASNLTPANVPMMRLVHDVAQRYGAIPGSLHDGQVAAIKQLWRLAYREADAFYAIMLAFAVATFLVPLMRNVSSSGGAMPARH
jgi:DHA2 family multidrug resistance protein